jgi:chromosome segregation ATPase
MSNPSPTMTTMTISWHEDAVKRAVEHARAMLDHGIDDAPIRPGAPLTWQDVAVLVDIARNLEEDRADLKAARADAASNAATLSHVNDRLADLLLDYDKQPENLAAAIDDVRTTVDTLAWLLAEAKHNHQKVLDRERWRQESEHVGYLAHRDELLEALGQHAQLPATSLKRHITEDVTALREAYGTVEAELIEWRTGQRAVEASAVQWVEIRSTLDETLAAVRKLAHDVAGDEEHFEGELPADEQPAEPLKFTHDNEE